MNNKRSFGNQPSLRESFSVTGRVRSVNYAVRGIRLMFATQHNAWIHACLTAAAGLSGLVLGIGSGQWCSIVIAIVMVWTAEALNTSLELLCDVASPEFHPLVKNAKDVAAGGVLISAVGSAIIGTLVFGPALAAWVVS